MSIDYSFAFSPPSVKTVSIVGDSKLGVNFTKSKMGVAVETLMRVEFHELDKVEVSFKVGVHA
jgi:hypothetical protein